MGDQSRAAKLAELKMSRESVAARAPFPRPLPGEEEGAWRAERPSKRKDLKRASISSSLQDAFGERSEVAPAGVRRASAPGDLAAAEAAMAEEEALRAALAGSLPAEALPRRGSLADDASTFTAATGRKSIKDVMRVNGRGPTRAGTLQLDPAQGKDRKFLEEMFCCYDPNGDGTGSLRPKDFASLCKAVGLRLKKAEVKALMRQLDLNGNGEIELHEFALFFNRATTRAELKRTVKEVGGSKNAYVRKLFEEFKHPRLPGVDEDGLLELANIAQVDLDERELRLFFRRLDARANLGFISQDDLLLFMTNVEERPKLLEHLETAGRGNKLFLREVYDAFDTSRGGNMSELDLLSAARFLGVQISEKGLGDMLARIDTNRDGTVSIDEFMDFFSQVSSTEELMEALQDFGAAKARSRYVLAFSALLGMALCAVGLGLSYAPDQSEDGVALGIAFTILGLCVLLLVLAQTFLEAFIMDVVLPALMKWNLTKVLKVGTAFVTLGCAMLILGVLGFVRGPLAGFGAIMFILPVVVAVLCGPFYYFFLKVGWLEPVPDIDSPLPQVRKSGPPSARAAFEAEEATAAP